MATLALIGCSQMNSGGGGGDGGISPTMQGPTETTYCSTAIPVTGSSVTITGTAKFNQRQIWAGGLGNASTTSGAHPAVAKPIRYAEVRVTNPAGGVAQCATTDVNGAFSFALPQASGNYTISVNARANNSHLYASVLDSPARNQFYSLTTTVSSASSTSVGTITALANGDTLAGAFNILDQLVNANDYLVTQVGTCASTFTGCPNYDPTLHKISAYWMKGFNPNDYFGSGGGGLSFYLPGYSRLFILGGLNGDTDNSDTDHFDNSVIIHEYGHFLEDNWLKTDSPGGSHDGNSLLDPRLAWSEGWGDFIQAAVRNDNHYIDTLGNSDGATSLAFFVDVEDTDSGYDYTDFAGEGNFREFAITRLLWDAVDTNADAKTWIEGSFTDNISGKFNEIWASLAKASVGFRDPSYAFRNVGLLHLLQENLQNHYSASDWSSIRGLNRHDGDESHYGQYLLPSTSGLCTTSPTTNVTNSYLVGNSYYFTITPASGDTGSYSSSDLFRNNRFYHIKITSPGVHTLQLVYQDTNGVAQLADLDLYLYNNSARFAVTSDILGMSRASIASTGNPERVLQTETVSANLAVGDYLINVNVYTGSGVGTQADYNLLLDTVKLCPANLVPL